MIALRHGAIIFLSVATWEPLNKNQRLPYKETILICFGKG